IRIPARLRNSWTIISIGATPDLRIRHSAETTSKTTIGDVILDGLFWMMSAYVSPSYSGARSATSAELSTMLIDCALNVKAVIESLVYSLPRGWERRHLLPQICRPPPQRISCSLVRNSAFERLSNRLRNAEAAPACQFSRKLIRLLVSYVQDHINTIQDCQ